MFKFGLYFLIIIFSQKVLALIPLEGIIFGNVEDIKQYDPLKSILNKRFSSDKGMPSLGKYYYGVFKQGSELVGYCEQNPQLNYSNQWQKAIAARSVAATLQYIGIDKSLKAIVGYAKKLDYTESEFQNLTKNLIAQTCTPNLSVYSLKLIKSNFDFQWKNFKGFDRSLYNTSLYYSDDYKARQNTATTLKREFEYTLRNFRAFCSWGGDTSNFRMLVPYLKNPFIMAHIFNNMQKKKMSLAPQTKEIILTDDENGIQVACEDLVCRNRNEVEFNRIFPRMTGSTKLRDDLYNLYCEYFSRERYRRNNINPQVLKWIEAQTLAESKVEALQFLSLITEVPDSLVVATTYKGIDQFFVDNIKGRWDKWSNEKLNQFYNDQMYEEPLEIKLVEQALTDKVYNGEFNILFDIGLSEIDKVLEEVDKIDAVFSLEMPISYLALIKERMNFLTTNAQTQNREKFFNKIVDRINHKMRLKQKVFKVPLWNEQISILIADELVNQLKQYRGKKLQRISKKTMKIPVRMRFGVFALRYIRQKFKFEQKNLNTLTFK